MEERLSAPLPLLQLDHDQENSDARSLVSVASTTGPLTTPKLQDDTQIIIHWQAAHILAHLNHSVDPKIDALQGLLTKIPGAFGEIAQVPIIKSYMNMLLLLQEKDSQKQWITRIPYFQEDDRFLVDQVEPLIRAEKRFNFRVPHLYTYDLSKSGTNVLKLDYMLLDFIDGDMMPMWTENFPTDQQKHQVLDGLADIYVEMFSKPVTYADRLALPNANNPKMMQDDFDAFEIPPSTTAALYLFRLADEAIRDKVIRLLDEDSLERAMGVGISMQHRYEDLLILLLMRASIQSYIIGRYNDSPFYITHPDLHNRNIIIQGKPIENPKALQTGHLGNNPTVFPNRSPTFRGFRSVSLQESNTAADSPLAVATEPASERPKFTNVGNSSGIDKCNDRLNIVGVIDWDAAHPLPLQLAAIYPKFLDTLPGAEFPDLPSSYKAPDLSREKQLFLNLFAEKERQQTGHTTASDLMANGSRERDFFTVAFRRGDVRIRWAEEWWQKQRLTRFRLDGEEEREYDEYTQENLDTIRAGLQGFLAKSENVKVVEDNNGWGLVAGTFVDLEERELFAVHSHWAEYGMHVATS